MQQSFPYTIADHLCIDRKEYVLTSDGRLYFSDRYSMMVSKYLTELVRDYGTFCIRMRDQNLHQRDVVMENTSVVEFSVEPVRGPLKHLEDIVLFYSNDDEDLVGVENIAKNQSVCHPVLDTLKYSKEMYAGLDILWNRERVRCFSVSRNGNICLVTESNTIYVFGKVGNYVGKKCIFRAQYRVLNFIRLRPPKLACQKSQYCDNEFSSSNDFQITQIECGLCNIIVQCRNRDIYVIGDNSMLLIGLEHRSVYSILTPMRISVLNDLEYVVQMACLNSSTLFLTSEGRILFTGAFKSKSNGIEVFTPPVQGKVSKISGDSSNMIAFLMEDNQTVCLYLVNLRFGEMIFKINEEKGHIIDIDCTDSCCYILTSEGFIETISFSKDRTTEWTVNYGMTTSKTPSVIVENSHYPTPCYYFQTEESDLYPILPNSKIVQFLTFNPTPSFITNIESRNVKYFKQELHFQLIHQLFSDIQLHFY